MWTDVTRPADDWAPPVPSGRASDASQYLSPVEAGDARTDEQRNAWIQHGLGELLVWLDRTRAKVEFIEAETRARRYPYIDESEVVFALAAVINRLAQIDMRQFGNIRTDKIAKWITRCTGWPEAVATSFWRCIRNPVIHMGRYHGLSDYGSRAGSDVPILASLEFIRPYTPDPPSEGSSRQLRRTSTTPQAARGVRPISPGLRSLRPTRRAVHTSRSCSTCTGCSTPCSR